MRLIFLVATALILGTAMCQAGQVKIRPNDLPADAKWPYFMSVMISAPWEQEGEWELRSPETIGSNHGLLFIDHNRPDMPTVTNPIKDPKWSIRPDGSMFYACHLDNGVVTAVKVTPGKNDITITATLKNGFREHLSNMGNQYCLIHSKVPDFCDQEAKRSFIPVNGKWIALADTKPGNPNPDELPFFIVTNTLDREPLEKAHIDRSWWCDEQADIPIIATVSKDGKRIIAMAFDNSYKTMTNACIPCTHADPMFPDCLRGNTVSIRGKIYFLEGGKLNDIFPLFYRDFPEWKNRQPFKK